MPHLTKVVVSHLRNIEHAEIHLDPGFNLIYGDNGTGKTSVLEAVHLLGMGRSFRSHQQKPLIKDGCAEATVFGLTQDGLALGIQRPVRGSQVIHVAGKKAESLAELSRQLPVQLVNTDTLNILEGSPQERRRFIDWGVFHVEQQFMDCWRRARLALQQRNSLLKQNAAFAEIDPWTHELVRSAELIDQQRAAYISRLKLHLKPGLSALLRLDARHELTLVYQRGWPDNEPLYERLQAELDRDRRYGFTSLGPHRADLQFKIGTFAAAEMLSRGQLKLLVCALKTAQGELLLHETGQRCLFLVDDLPAELDRQNRAQVLQLLAELNGQVLLTCIEKDMLEPELAGLAASPPYKRFHVKHGIIAPDL